MAEDENLRNKLEAMGYTNCKRVNEKWVAMLPFAFTTAILVDLKESGYERRYCFEHESEAIESLEQYVDPNAHPSGPWIKVKGYWNGCGIDALNPSFCTVEEKESFGAVAQKRKMK
jgi:hypothetical protein